MRLWCCRGIMKASFYVRQSKTSSELLCWLESTSLLPGSQLLLYVKTAVNKTMSPQKLLYVWPDLTGLRSCWGFEARKTFKRDKCPALRSRGSSQVERWCCPSVTLHHTRPFIATTAGPLSATTKVLNRRLEFVRPDPEWESFKILHKKGAHCCNRNLRPIKKKQQKKKESARTH